MLAVACHKIKSLKKIFKIKVNNNNKFDMRKKKIVHHFISKECFNFLLEVEKHLSLNAINIKHFTGSG